MIGKINSAAFKGTIFVQAGDSIKKNNNGNIIIENVNPINIDTSCVTNIHPHEKRGYTTIQTMVPHQRGNLMGNVANVHYVPTSFASTDDILKAYTAANTSDFLHIQLEDKSSK